MIMPGWIRTHGLPCLVASVYWVGSTHAVDRENLRFYLSFEDGVMPAISAGKAGPGNTTMTFRTGADRDIKRVPGRRGMGLRMSPAVSLHYEALESLSRDEGTIAFWIKPVGWSGLKQGRRFLSVLADRAGLHFYIYPGNLYYYISSGQGRYYLINTAEDGNQKDPFKDGQWTFLAGTFKPGEQRFFVNGDFMNAMTEGLIEPRFSSRGTVEIQSGDQVLDEIMIFDRALTDKAVKAIYEANAPRAGRADTGPP